MAQIYEVTAKIAGSRRARTKLNFTTKAAAQKYADETNKFYPGANAKVVKGAKRFTK